MPEDQEASIQRWFLADAERRNPASDIRAWTSGNTSSRWSTAAAYFPPLYRRCDDTRAGDQVYFADFRGDTEELLDGPGTSVGEVLAELAARGVARLRPDLALAAGLADQSEGKNAELAREVSDAGGEVLLDSRTRRAGSHHQKFVVIRHPGRPERDVAFFGGHRPGPEPQRRRGQHTATRRRWTSRRPTANGRRGTTSRLPSAGPAVADIEHTFRERWYGSTRAGPVQPGADADRPRLPRRQARRPGSARAAARARAGRARTPCRCCGRIRPGCAATRSRRSGSAASPTPTARCFARARRLIYIEDQYLWAPFVADLLADALRRNPDLHVVAVVPRFPDKEGDGRGGRSLVGREQAIRVCRAAGGDRFAIYDVENAAGTPVYVHAKVVVVDDVWAMIGSDNLNRRSWTHDSELSCAVLDDTRDEREPRDPAGLGDGARAFARDLRLRLWREHLGLDAGDDLSDLIDPRRGFDGVAAQRRRPRPVVRTAAGQAPAAGATAAARPERMPRRHRPWAVPVYRWIYDPDGRAIARSDPPPTLAAAHSVTERGRTVTVSESRSPSYSPSNSAGTGRSARISPRCPRKTCACRPELPDDVARCSRRA